MADTPEYQTMTHAAYDEYAMRAFRESLEQARKALRETDHMVTPDRGKLVHRDPQEKPEERK